MKPVAASVAWPDLTLKDWQPTRDTLHMWTQIVGKVRLGLTPLQNHWWNVPLYLQARGLTTSFIPYGPGGFEFIFDFIDHQLVYLAQDGTRKTMALYPRSVSDFYREFMQLLSGLGIAVKIWPVPVEIPDPIPFDQDVAHAAYDPEAVGRFWRILTAAQRVFEEFRGHYIGKCSPVHFFWGSFDLAVTRFSGRRAPARPGADAITAEAYSHEVSSVGFWPGGGNVPDAAFYSYTAPEPKGFRNWKTRPAAARYDTSLGEFILMYEDVRGAENPDQTLLDFCQSSYEAGAVLGGWDRDGLERKALQRGPAS